MKSFSYLLCFMTVLLFGSLSPLTAQQFSSIRGKISDKLTGEAIPFANIILYCNPDSKLYGAITSDSTGSFSFFRIPDGNYRLEIHMIGYEKFSTEIALQSWNNYDAGTLLLNQDAISLGETVVTAERLKARQEKDKTTFFITGSMAEVSGNGLDVVKMVPGIQVDFRNNISLEGSQNILLMVDGRERDKNFVSQIRPDMIDRVEIMSAPPANYDATVTGVVNVILKKEKNSGINGQVNAELPSSGSVFVHPEYSLSFVCNKLTFFTSSNAEIIKFHQLERLERKISNIDGSFETVSNQDLVQRLLSNRFHYGLDYSSDKKWEAGYYGYYDIFSQKYNGMADAPGDFNNTVSWQALRSSTDLIKSNFNSIFFKYKLGERGSNLDIDLSNYHFSGNNADTYIPVMSDIGSGSLRNESLPLLDAITIKTDLKIVPGKRSTINAGVKLRSQKMEDMKASGFEFSEKTFALYGSVGVNRPAYEWTFGLRLEQFASGLKNSFSNNYLSLLPSATFNLKLKNDRSLKMAVSRNITRPGFYQLNPVLSYDDPYGVHSGNPMLNPEIRTSAYLEYSVKAGSNYLSGRLFYNRNSDVISNMTWINDTSVFETRIYNLGIIHQTGLQFSGTFKAGGKFNFIPYLRLYDNYCDVNQLANQYFVKNRNQVVFESGLSAIAAFNHDVNLSANFQYSTPKNSVQSNSFSDALYFISLEKIFKKTLKASIVSVLPFSRRFTYQGSESTGPDFSSRYTGEVLVRNLLMSVKVNYQFSYGKKSGKINRSTDDGVVLPKKGL